MIQEKEKALARLSLGMIHWNQDDPAGIAHFTKVHAYAHLIALEEGLDEETRFLTEAEAILHDISIKVCKEKYEGKANGALQELESASVLEGFLPDYPELSDAQKDRLIQVISKHHTYTNVLGIDHQILLEADFLVNSQEGKESKEAVRSFRDQVFKTRTGIRIINEMYGLG